MCLTEDITDMFLQGIYMTILGEGNSTLPLKKNTKNYFPLKLKLEVGVELTYNPPFPLP